MSGELRLLTQQIKDLTAAVDKLSRRVSALENKEAENNNMQLAVIESNKQVAVYLDKEVKPQLQKIRTEMADRLLDGDFAVRQYRDRVMGTADAHAGSGKLQIEDRPGVKKSGGNSTFFAFHDDDMNM